MGCRCVSSIQGLAAGRIERAVDTTIFVVVVVVAIGVC
jgi:hypothetical protein